jgi:hypothetical protein
MFETHDSLMTFSMRRWYIFDMKKFLYLFQCEEYDIVEIIVRGVNEIYNRRNELIDKYFFLNISVKDIFV